MSESVAVARSDWRRHDIVYSPILRKFGTVVNDVANDVFCRIQWSDGTESSHTQATLDEWQRINDERGKP